MELEQVIPHDFGSFKLKATGEVVHKLRKFSLFDHTWVKNQTGMTLPEVMNLGKTDALRMWEEIAKIIYHLLQDQSPFQKVEVTRYDENGDAYTAKIGGPSRLLDSISGTEEPNHVMAAFGKCMETSDPVVSVQKKTEEPTQPPAP